MGPGVPANDAGPGSVLRSQGAFTPKLYSQIADVPSLLPRAIIGHPTFHSHFPTPRRNQQARISDIVCGERSVMRLHHEFTFGISARDVIFTIRSRGRIPKCVHEVAQR